MAQRPPLTRARSPPSRAGKETNRQLGTTHNLSGLRPSRGPAAPCAQTDHEPTADPCPLRPHERKTTSSLISLSRRTSWSSACIGGAEMAASPDKATACDRYICPEPGAGSVPTHNVSALAGNWGPSKLGADCRRAQIQSSALAPRRSFVAPARRLPRRTARGRTLRDVVAAAGAPHPVRAALEEALGALAAPSWSSTGCSPHMTSPLASTGATTAPRSLALRLRGARDDRVRLFTGSQTMSALEGYENAVGRLVDLLADVATPDGATPRKLGQPPPPRREVSQGRGTALAAGRATVQRSSSAAAVSPPSSANARCSAVLYSMSPGSPIE